MAVVVNFSTTFFVFHFSSRSLLQSMEGIHFLLRRFLDSSRLRSTSKNPRRFGRCLRVEPLETRALLATFAVNTFLDTVDANPGDDTAVDASGNTSLRAAVMEANALGGSHTIQLQEGTYGLDITTPSNEDGAHTTDLDITANITVIGAGADKTTIDANGLYRIFHVHNNATLDLRGVALTGGSVMGASDGGAGGAAILSTGTLSVSDSVIRGNVGLFRGALDVNGLTTIERTAFLDNQAVNDGLTKGSGGAISARSATVTIRDSLFSGNSATGSGGAITQNFGQFWIENSTFSGNYLGASPTAPLSASQFGGGIYANDGVLHLTHATIADNRAGSGGGIASSSGSSVQMTNSLVAQNDAPSGVTAPSGMDIHGPVASNGGNLIGVYDGWGTFIASDILGSTVNPVDPVLGALADNGGPTLTHALLRGSPAIDAAVAAPALSSDQRGLPRPVGAAPDIGAYELQPSDPGYNRPPVAVDDFFAVIGDGEFVAEAPGVLANDSDPDGDPLEAVLTGAPSHGTLQLNADGSFSYVPNAGFTGIDSFTYQVSDGQLQSGLATVTLEITAVTDTIEIDIKPDDPTNTIDLAKESWVTVAILGNEYFDVTQIDVRSLRFGATGTEDSIERSGKGAKATIVVQWVDIDGDGHLDLVVRFETKKTGLAVGDTQATLTGSLLDGRSFEIAQDVEVVSSSSGGGGGKGNGKPPKK
jgi:hypothetical protein